MGYTSDHIDAYGELIDAYISTVSTSLTRMRRTDNNGQISAHRKNNNKYIGKRTYSNKTDKGGGESLISICQKQDFVCANTLWVQKDDESNLCAWRCDANNVSGGNRIIAHLYCSHAPGKNNTRRRTLQVYIQIHLSKRNKESDTNTQIPRQISELREDVIKSETQLH